MDLDRRTLVGSLAGLSVAPAVAVAEEPANRRVALSVGVQDYARLNKLTRSAADAEAIARSLEAMGYSARSVVDPDRDKLQAAIETFVASIRPESSAIFFFAGHGFQVGGANYLATRDTTPTTAALFDTAFPLTDILQRMAARSPRQGIVILDACREGAGLAGTVSQRQGFSGIQAPGGFYIVYSAGSGELALEDLGAADKNPNGVFTRAFVKCLKPDVSIGEAVKLARPEVTSLAASVGHPQHPATYDQTVTELTLAGDPLPPSTIRPPPVIPNFLYVPNCDVKIVSQELDSHYPSPAGPQLDFQLMRDRLGSLSDSTAGLINPVLVEFRKRALEPGEGHSNLVLYWTGYGGYLKLPGGREAFFTVNADFTDRTHRGNADLMSLGEIVGRLKSPKRRLLIFADIGLQDLQTSFPDPRSVLRVGSAAARMGQPSNALDVLMDPILDDAARTQTVGNTAVLFAGAFDAPFDVSGRRGRSAFATAVANALGHPGLTVRQLADLVKREVEDITKGAQSPYLVGVQSAIDRPLVRRRAAKLVYVPA
ncbi:MAG: caspase domain-containing protein [Phenylobacterium sp.]